MRIISGRFRGTKLFTLDGDEVTRPTLYRIKEPLFNILQFKFDDAICLDLFAGSGALGLEAISRGAKKTYFSEVNRKAQEIVEKNIEKTKTESQTILIKKDFEKALEEIKDKIDICFIDPPYKTDLVYRSLKKIIELKLLNDDATVVVETDEPQRVLKEIENLGIEVIDTRKYGRVTLMFIKESKA